MDSRPAADVVEQFNRGGLWVAILVMSGWHVCATLPFVVTAWAAYGLARSGVLLWVAYAAVGAVSARAVLRGGWQRPALPWGGCCLLLAGVLATMLTLPGGVFSPA